MADEEADIGTLVLPRRGSIVIDPKASVFALLIGVNDYASDTIANLNGPYSDAKDVQEYLVKDLGVDESHITFLGNEQATRAAIIKAFISLSTDERIQQDDAIVIYFAGHGAVTPSPNEWKSERHSGEFTKMLLPHDVRTKLTLSDDSDAEVRGIPDRTFRAFLSLIAKEKGDNIVS